MRDRTADLFAASEALSQLSYSPKCNSVTGLIATELTQCKLLLQNDLQLTTNRPSTC
jgi:hypothetical protein